jgi:hypothetical protein
MPVVSCPSCGQQLQIAPNESDITVACARCSYRFVPSGRIPATQPQAAGFECPICHSPYPPYYKTRATTAAWILFVVLILGACTIPFCWIPLVFMRERMTVCSSCGTGLGVAV